MHQQQHPLRRTAGKPVSMPALCQKTLDRIAAGRRHFGIDQADGIVTLDAVPSAEAR